MRKYYYIQGGWKVWTPRNERVFAFKVNRDHLIPTYFILTRLMNNWVKSLLDAIVFGANDLAKSLGERVSRGTQVWEVDFIPCLEHGALQGGHVGMGMSRDLGLKDRPHGIVEGIEIGRRGGPLLAGDEGEICPKHTRPPRPFPQPDGKCG